MNGIARSGSAALLIFLLPTSAPPRHATPLAGTVVAFVDVNVVPMDRERLLAHQTVLVRDGRIVSILPVSAGQVPESATVIAGNGTKYLMPGLVDAHVHSSLPDEFPLYVMNGVTTVLHMGEKSSHDILRMRRSIDDGTIVGPRVFAAFRLDGPGGTGVIVRNAAEARDAVRYAACAGYQYIKVYNSLSPDAFFGLVREARRDGLGVVGHGVRSVGLRAGMAAGQVLVAHAEEFLYTEFPKGFDTLLIAPLAGFVRAANAFVSPTLSTYEMIAQQWGRPAAIDSFFAKPYGVLLSDHARQEWTLRDYVQRKGSIAANVTFLRRLVKTLSDSAVPLLVGTDAPAVPGMAPGFATHEELESLVNAGLSPYQALAAATRTFGEFLRATGRDRPGLGTVVVGAPADLLLMDDNPLQDVGATRHLDGVLLRGRWFSKNALDAMRDSMAQHVSGEHALLQNLRQAGQSHDSVAFAQALARLRSAKAALSSEAELNDLAYEFLDQKDVTSARLLFRLNSELFPGSSDAFESLAEAHLAAQDTVASLTALRRALAIDPYNSDARDVQYSLPPQLRAQVEPPVPLCGRGSH